MRPRPARSPWRLLAPGRQQSARCPVLILLALLTTLGGVLAADAAPPSRTPGTARMLATSDLSIFAADSADAASSWLTRPTPATDVGAAWRHVAKVKRAAARMGHRGSRGLTVLLLVAVLALLTAVIASLAADRTSDRRAGYARTAIGHPRRAPPALTA